MWEVVIVGLIMFVGGFVVGIIFNISKSKDDQRNQFNKATSALFRYLVGPGDVIDTPLSGMLLGIMTPLIKSGRGLSDLVTEFKIRSGQSDIFIVDDSSEDEILSEIMSVLKTRVAKGRQAAINRFISELNNTNNWRFFDSNTVFFYRVETMQDWLDEKGIEELNLRLDKISFSKTSLEKYTQKCYGKKAILLFGHLKLSKIAPSKKDLQVLKDSINHAGGLKRCDISKEEYKSLLDRLVIEVRQEFIVKD